MVINEIFNSEFRVYYLAFATAMVAAFMCILFLVFKSVATLMMVMSAILIMIVSIIILGAAVYLDYMEGRFRPSYPHISDRY